MTGLSARNLQYMRTLVESWPDAAEFAQQPVAQLPWGHITILLGRLDDQELREWYAAQALVGGWSRSVLLDRIKGRLHERVGRAPSNFSDQLPPADSDLARELTRDPYHFDFLGLTGRIAERDLEDGLVGQLERFLRELGRGFAFVGRQYRIEIEGEEYYIDLLFFNFEQNRFVVVELKVGGFEPAFVGQLGFYVSWVDANLRRPDAHATTVGILLCTTRNEGVVHYALRGAGAPMAIADYTYDTLPADERRSLPNDRALLDAIEPYVQRRLRKAVT
jgi:predicted nuclease of restriction endonuclease-like (RecB) superfamily